MKQQSSLVIWIVPMALGLTGGLLQHCSRFLESLPHCSLQISKTVEAFFLCGSSSAKPARAGPCCCWVPSGICCWKQTGKGEMFVCIELCRRLLGPRWWVFWTEGMNETAVVPLCLLQQNFVSGFIVICCFLHGRLKKGAEWMGYP